MANHPIVHIEIPANNIKETARFYGALFGWKIEEFPEMDFTSFNPGDGPAGGFNQVSDTYPAKQVLLYVETDDIEASLKRAEELGGRVIKGKTDIPGMGWWGLFEDPSGTRIGLYTGLPQA